MKATAIGIAALALAACGGGAPTNNGTIHGRTFTPVEVIATAVPGQNLGDSQVQIFVSDTAGVCADLQQNEQPKNIAYLLLSAADYDSGSNLLSAPTVPGTYVITPHVNPGLSAKVAVGSYVHEDASCQAILTDGAVVVSGSIVFTSIDNGTGTYQGTYDVTLNSNDRVTGTFAGSSCIASATAGTITCI
jgi:hypothetical protein